MLSNSGAGDSSWESLGQQEDQTNTKKKSTLNIHWMNWCWSWSSKTLATWCKEQTDWLDLPAVQETLKSLLQHHSSKASILWQSAFFMVQLSCPYMTTGKKIALTSQTFVGKLMSLLFNMLSRLVITFLPRSKCILISWLQSPSAVILEPQKWSLTLFPHLFPMKWWDQMPYLSFMNVEL